MRIIMRLVLLLLLCAAPLYAFELTAADLGWQGWFTIVLFLLTFVALIKEVLPPELILLICAVTLVFFGIVTPTEFLLGFSKDIIFSIAMLCIIVRAMEKSGVLSIVSKNILSRSKNHMLQLLSIMLPVGISSAFMNNTPIVLLMTSLVRQWALERNLSPSKFLIPLSYAAILGGMCTLIGTSTNLIVDGLLRNDDPANGLTLFELSLIGIPLLLLGFLYILTIGYRLLPIRQDVTTAVVEQAPDFTGEFVVKPGCPIIGKTVFESGKKYFHDELLIEIERNGYVIDSPNPEDVIMEGDRLVFAGDIQHIAELHAVEELQSLADPHFHLDVTSPHFSEVVISVTSSLIGKTLKQSEFRTTYGASTLAIYREGRRLSGNVGDIVLRAGDTLMLLSKEPWYVGETYTGDFFYIRQNQELSLFSPWRFAWVASVLGTMIVCFMLGVPLVVATLAAAFLLMATRNVSIGEAKQSIRWDLLVLIACSFSLGTALQKTGVANYFAEGILYAVGTDPNLMVGALFFVTSCVTALITNNAAVLLLFPIAIQTAHLAGFESLQAVKAIGITIAVGSSCSFATPIGYQANMIVYGPGGYRFGDYLKVGLPLTILTFIMTVILIPRIWPLV